MPHELLTDEIIAKAARAAFLKFVGDTPQSRATWDNSYLERDEWIEETRAALEAALPDLRRAFMIETDRHWRLKKRRVPKEKTHAA